MVISELIELLEDLKKKEGDLKVFVDDGYVLSDGVSLRIHDEKDKEKMLIIR